MMNSVRTNTFFLLLLCLPFFGAVERCSGETAGNMLAIRLASYYDAQDEALAHAASCGFKYVFMNIIPPEKVEETQKELAKYGLKVAVFRGDTDLSRPSSVDELAEQLATCEKMGVRYMFLSPKHSGFPKVVAIHRLKQIGEIARRHGVTIGLETHPDLGTNGDVHAETMRAIDHPNIRVNFDCANITFYNKGADAVTELKKCIDYVGTVEIKDHDGQYKSWHFPTLGQGVVDIPAVLGLLKQHHYRGPITIEVEGCQGVQKTREEIKQGIAESAAYLRTLGNFN